DPSGRRRRPSDQARRRSQMRRSWRRLPEPAFASARIRPAKFSLHAKPSEERICRHEAVRLGKSEVIAPKLAPSLVQRQSQGAMHANRNRGAADEPDLSAHGLAEI